MEHDLKTAKRIGKGTYGEIYKVNDKAIKRNICDDEQDLRALRELAFLREVKSHPSFVQIKGLIASDAIPEKVWKDKTNETFHFIMDLGDCDLSDYMENIQDVEEIKNFLVQTLLGLEYLHSKKIGHFDLKPGNIIVKEKEDGIHYQICDLGISERWSNRYLSTKGLITSIYRAPEVAAKLSNYDGKADIWSLGCILYEIINSGKSFITLGKITNSSAIFKAIIQSSQTSKEDLEYFEKTDVKITKHKKFIWERMPELKPICLKMLTLNPEDRPSASDLLNLPLFSDYSAMIAATRKKLQKSLKFKIQVSSLRNHIIEKLQDLNTKDNENFSYNIIFKVLMLYDRIFEKLKTDIDLFIYTAAFIYHIIENNLNCYSPWKVFCDSKFKNKDMNFLLLKIIRETSCRLDHLTIYDIEKYEHIPDDELWLRYSQIENYYGNVYSIVLD